MMNRMAPLIRRPAPAFDGRQRPVFTDRRTAVAPDPLEDLKLFATGWLGGLIFFGTLFS